LLFDENPRPENIWREATRELSELGMRLEGQPKMDGARTWRAFVFPVPGKEYPQGGTWGTAGARAANNPAHWRHSIFGPDWDGAILAWRYWRRSFPKNRRAPRPTGSRESLGRESSVNSTSRRHSPTSAFIVNEMDRRAEAGAHAKLWRSYYPAARNSLAG